MSDFPSRRRFLQRAAASGLLLSAAGGTASALSPPIPHKRRNLLLITVDTLRADHTGCCGYERSTTPRIDQLAREGMLFDQVNVQYGLTWPSLASIMTAMPVQLHGVKNNETLMAAGTPTLGTSLDDAGFHCGAFLGFAEKQRWEGFSTVDGGRHLDDGQLTSRFLEWFDKECVNADAPFFGWIHFYGPHLPWRPDPAYGALFSPEPQLECGSINYQYQISYEQRSLQGGALRDIIDLYDAEIRRTDDCIDQILQHLSTAGMLDHTLVAVSADHGTELYDHHNYGLHWGSPYNGVYRVPLVLWGPGMVPAQRLVSRPVRSIDIAPTLMDLLGQPAPDRFMGTSLTPLLAGDVPPGPPLISEYSEGKILIVRDGDQRFIWNPQRYQNNVIPVQVVEEFKAAGIPGGQFRMPLERYELYDLREDLKEQNNLADARVAEVARYADLAAAWKQSLASIAHGVQNETIDDEAHRESLKALGYL